MKKLLSILLIISILCLSACRTTTEPSFFETPEQIDGYEHAVFEKFNSYASVNGLGGTRVYLDGVLEEDITPLNDSQILAVLNDGKHRWSVGIPKSATDFIGKEMRLFAIYTGFSDKLNLPCVIATRFTITNTGESHHTLEYTELGRISFSAYEEGFIESGQENNPNTSQTEEPKLESASPIPTPEITESPKKPVNLPQITLNEFNQLFEGISYEAAIEIIGSSGDLLSESSLGGITTKMYSWDGNGDIGANANAMFQNGKLVTKAQVGLK